MAQSAVIIGLPHRATCPFCTDEIDDGDGYHHCEYKCQHCAPCGSRNPPTQNGIPHFFSGTGPTAFESSFSFPAFLVREPCHVEIAANEAAGSAASERPMTDYRATS
jgi:hypothetical protein